MNFTFAPRRAATLVALTLAYQLNAPSVLAHIGNAGGSENTANGAHSFIGGGWLNRASVWASAVCGGTQNEASGGNSFVGGGSRNKAASALSAVGAGKDNTAGGYAATVSGGLSNTASAQYATVAGGSNNTAFGEFSIVAGGTSNSASQTCSTVAGGSQNGAIGTGATVGGGQLNAAMANFATVPGGARGKALHAGSFVWSGVTNVDTVSTNVQSFTVRAPGGVRFITTRATNGFDIYDPVRPPMTTIFFTNGVALAPNATAWTSLSDSNAKTAVKNVDPREVLSKLERMPVTEWEYKHDPHRRYFGPMAQDFHAAFGLGNDDKTINTLDADGVLFLSVKGLAEELKERDKTIEELKARNEELSRNIEAINERLNALPPRP